MTVLRVAEVFGPTLQGEGPTAGRHCAFIRLSGCNLECTWCDTPFTWDWKGKLGTAYDRKKESRGLDIGELCKEVADMGVDRVVITGGEPLTQAKGLVELINELGRRGFAVEVETNGTRPVPEGITHPYVRWNVSPKLSNSGNELKHRFKPDALASFVATGMAAFKFVVRDAEDVMEVIEMTTAAEIPLNLVWLMPEGITAETINKHLAVIAPLAVEGGFNLSNRLHVMVWGNERGH